ncbi:ComEC/Rec2 family competence protein [Arcobacter ellisii]|uniref:Competence protein n=1 Tax=Arcobacter ellisii TaxID=913109 RepID=A0A347U8M9_9BACT|nr:ComEC/Rec2 family competence protein [Arcobacter ellisii]AXX95207.1 competence protein, ComEC family [Arcobacter ellisii]RXI30143.1 competence protein [Arcobacter ellisii]
MIIYKEKSKQIVTILFLFFIFLLNLSIEYSKYLDLIEEEIFETQVEVLNIYQKDDFDILKLKASNFDFFTSFPKDEKIDKFQILNIVFISKDISFLEYLKGFYTKTVYFDFLEKEEKFKDKIIKKINSNHQDKMISELFQALFLALPISKELRDICTNYGIAHVIALSGFHIVVLSFCIYWIVYFPYSFFHQKFFPYRNKRFDILIFTLIFLLYYLILTDIVPSLLRAFVMFCLGIYLLRSNIKIFSYMTLFYTFLIVIAFFPKYIFSLGFWFSIIAVFYIYLFMQYFKNLNKYFQLFFFNLWMFLIFNPIVHLFFPQTTIEQFLSIIITIAFTLFYPFEIVAHTFDFAIYFDEYIKNFLEYKFFVYEVKTPLYFFIVYLIFSFLSIFYKKAFYILNLLMILFNLFLYLRF